MTDKEQIERISKLLNELSLDDITSTEFDEEFPKQSINDLKDELWRMYCFAGDVCDTINMGDTAEQKPKIGHWIEMPLIEAGQTYSHECSLCGRRILINNLGLSEFPYCHCGAKMESEG